MGFVKLKDITEFTINSCEGKVYKRWDTVLKKMETSDVWAKDYKLTYTFNTDKGLLDLSQSQLGQLLSMTYNPVTGEARVNGKTFTVKTNGQSGMEIRYFFGMKNQQAAPVQPKTEEQARYSQEAFQQAVEAGRAESQMNEIANEFGGKVIPSSEVLPF